MGLGCPQVRRTSRHPKLPSAPQIGLVAPPYLEYLQHLLPLPPQNI